MHKNYMTASLIAIGVALSVSPANAQNEPAGNAGEQGAANSAATEVRMGDIVVTAQRREERNQDVPIAITAFSNERLQQQNISTAQGLNGVVPSLVVGANAQASRDVQGFTLRGIKPTNQGAASVVTYLAEVPLPQGYTTSQQGGPGNFLDLETVQVAAGPQGTLFGRNSTGGTVLLVPHKPTNKLEGYIQASYGNYDYVGVEGVINIPLVPNKLMIRAAGSYQDRDGFTRDIVWNKDRDDLHYYTGRLSILFQPTEQISNYLVAYGTRSHTNGTSYIHRGFNIDNLFRPFGVCADADGTCAIMQDQTDQADALGPRKTRLGVDEFDLTVTSGVINKTSVDLSDALTVNNIASYQRFKHDFALDEDGTPLNIGDLGPRYPTFPVAGLSEFGVAPNGYSNSRAFGPRDNIRQITEELQLQGNFLDNHLTFTAGGFYYDDKPVSNQLNRANFFCPVAFTGLCEPTYQSYSVANRSKALYAQGTLDLGALAPALESLRLTGGYRYTWERVKGSVTYYTPNLAAGTVNCGLLGLTTTNPADCTSSATLKYKAPTWTFGVDYKPISNLLVFGKVSRGFKAGGFNSFAVRPETLTFAPEKVTTYEAGFKSDWTLGTVPMRLNLTAYKTDYTGIQRQVGDFNNGAGGARTVTTSAKIKGIEADASFRPVPALEIGGNASYTDAKLDTPVATALTFDCVGAVAAGETINEGCPFGAPKWVYSIYGSLDLPVPESLGKVNLYASYSHVGKQVIDLNEPGAIFAPYGLLNLSARWSEVAGSNFDVEAFMTNATNKMYQISVSGVFQSVGIWSEVYGEPRMYGVRLRYHFGS